MDELMDQQKINLPENLTISELATFKSDIIDKIQNADDIELLDNDLKQIDTVGVQLLLAVVSEIAAKNKSLSWKINSQALTDSIKQLGLQSSTFKNYI